ncbi:unnamed protein product [Brachionus calyciflorus]|uniref:Acetyl-coenzyme A transporter 1 n=1 Tax=Brachionus calyciflorus TaxID=104777 RepID=A0A814A7L9_9BILA|nr:unnamed protein product [Brachionus calyciflorus]
MELQASEQERNQKSLIKRIRELNLKTVAYLTFLYILQGIPVGISTAIPLILSSKKVTYSYQGIYSFTRWPFSVRILWAPIIDRFFIQKIGRRKTWIFICQFMSGFLMLSTASLVDAVISTDMANRKSGIYILTAIFTVLVVLSATNDITLDAWSIDLLPEKNAGLQSLCNSVGMSIGIFIGGSGFLIFEAAEFSNKIRTFFNVKNQHYGLISIQKLFYIMGTALVITSISILKFKSEQSQKKLKTDEEQALVQKNAHLTSNFSIIDTYKLLWKILFIKPIRIWIILMITHRFAFSVESAFNIKLVEKGVAREKLSLIGAILSPIMSWLPLILIDLISRTKPLKLFRSFFILKMVCIAAFGIFLFFFDHFRDNNGKFSLVFYIILAIWKLVDGFFSSATSISLGSFNAHISDRLISGIYMTFLSFWPNIGANISRTSILFILNLITIPNCERDSKFGNITNTTFLGQRNSHKNQCSSLFEPIYPLTLVVCIFAAIWLLLSTKYFNRLQKLAKSEWEIKLES